MITLDLDKYSALYESNPDINILDKSAPGSGKTTQALQHIDYLIANGKCAIMVMQSYDLLEEALKRLQNKERALIFKGRTQEEICPYHEELKELYNHAITGYCGECNKRGSCEFFQQIEWIKRKRKDGVGICVFTVVQNVPTVLSTIADASKDVTIIVDDISISYLVEPTDNIPVDDLRQINNYLEEKKNNKEFEEYYFLLQEIVDFLLSDSSDAQALKDDYRMYGGDVYKYEREDLSNLIKKDLWNKGLPDCRILYKIINRLQGDKLFYKERNEETVFYTEYNSEFYQKYRILYLNALPASLETRETMPEDVDVTSLFELLGEYYTFYVPPLPNEKWVVLQVDKDDYKYSKKTMAVSKPVRDCIEEILSLNDGISKCLGVNCLLITNKDVYFKRNFGVEVRKWGYNHKHEYYFGDGVRSTNKHRNDQLCICAGTPYPSPDIYKKPHYNSVRCDNEMYSVSNDIVTIETGNELKQAFSRVLRDGNDPEACKLGIYFGNADLKDESGILSSNGAVVKNGYSLRAGKERTRFLKDVKKELQRIYREPLTKKLCEEVEKCLEKEGRVKLDSFAKDFIERNNLGKLYKSTDTIKSYIIKSYIEKNYDIDIIKENRVQAAYIFSKN